jgi:hypothetical protein
MSSIISLLRLVKGVSIALICWGVLALGITLSGAFTTVTAFGPQRGLLSAAATTDARIVSLGDRFVVLTGGASSFVWYLYKGGAWIVLPGDVTGCLRLPANGVR